MAESSELLSSLKEETEKNVSNNDAQSRMLGIIKQLENTMELASSSSQSRKSFMDEMKEPLRVCVCGGGHGAHAFVATITGSLHPRFSVNWLSFHGGEKLNETLLSHKNHLMAHFDQEKVDVTGTPNMVSSDASKVIPNCDIIVLCAPAYAHEGYLDAINKYHEICFEKENKNNKKLIIASFPSSSGLEFQVSSKLRNYNKGNIILCNCLTLPWACRFEEYGTLVEILGIKKEVEVTICNDKNNKFQTLEKVQSLFIDNVPKLINKSDLHIVATTLGYPSPVAHCCILYGQWKNWDGKEEFEKKPLFYHGITRETAKIISKLSDEVVAIGREVNLVAQKCGMKKVKVDHIDTIIRHYYADVCERTDTMWDIFVTNPGYNGLVHPMIPGKKDPKKWIPNFDYRYLTEDVPFGLLVIKAIGEMCENLKTPIMDMILLWCQHVMGKRYVKIKKVGTFGERYVKIDFDSQDVKESRIPQVYGMTTIEEMLRNTSIEDTLAVLQVSKL